MLGVPVKPTIKEVDGDRMVVKTLKRAALWEVQTPQASASGAGLMHCTRVAASFVQVHGAVGGAGAAGKPSFAAARRRCL